MYGKHFYVWEKILLFPLCNTIFSLIRKYAFISYYFIHICNIIFTSIFFLIQHICLLLWHYSKELSCCSCLVIVVEKRRLKLIFDVSSNVTCFMEQRGRKREKNWHTRVFPHWHWHMKKKNQFLPSQYETYDCLRVKSQQSKLGYLWKQGDGTEVVSGGREKQDNSHVYYALIPDFAVKNLCKSLSLWKLLRMQRAVYIDIHSYKSLGLSNGVTPCISSSREQIGGNYPHASSIYLLQKSL